MCPNRRFRQQMSALEQPAPSSPPLAQPRAPQRRLSLLQFMRVLRDNSLATYSAEAYTADILERRLFWKRTFFVNEPGAIKHILLDNATSYHKTEITRRLLEPGLGRGLLTSEGETWRRHRRIMAPAFDHRSIIGYAPIMTEMAERDRKSTRLNSSHPSISYAVFCLKKKTESRV